MGNSNTPPVRTDLPSTDLQDRLETLAEVVPGTGERLDPLKEGRNETVRKMKLGEFLARTPEEKLTDITNPPLLPSSLQENSSLQFDFHGNRTLERQISLADVMPPEVRKVTITDRGGEVLEGARRGLSGEFFTKSNVRLEIFTGTVAKIISMDSAKNREITDAEIEKYQFDHNDAEQKQIVRKSLEKGIDPSFALALRQTEGGSPEKAFGVLMEGIDTFDMQLEMALKIIGRYEGDFTEEYPDLQARDPEGRFTPEFLAYFSARYAPLGVANDPGNLNENHLVNLAKIYGYEAKTEEMKRFKQNHNEDRDVNFNLNEEIRGQIDSATDDLSSVAFDLSGNVERKGQYLASIRSVEHEGQTVLNCKGETPYIHVDALSDLLKMALVFHRLSGKAFTLNSGYRTESHQRDLDAANGDAIPTAAAGKSIHNIGFAIDVHTQSRYSRKMGGVSGLRYLAEKCNFAPIASEDWHFDHSSKKDLSPEERLRLSAEMDQDFHNS